MTSKPAISMLELIMSDLILPNYLLKKKYFKCDRCSFKYWRVTPSDIDRCPMCAKDGLTIKTIAEGTNKNNLDPYSQWKDRIYSDPLGRAHIEDIKSRSFSTENGKKIVTLKDKKGRTVDKLYQPAISKNKKEKRFNTV